MPHDPTGSMSFTLYPKKKEKTREGVTVTGGASWRGIGSRFGNSFRQGTLETVSKRSTPIRRVP